VTVLGDIATVIDCEHRTAPGTDHKPFGYSIGTRAVRGGRISIEDAKPVSKDTYLSWTRRATPAVGDLIFSREAPLGEVGAVPTGISVCLGQRTVLLRLDAEQVDHRFLLQILMAPQSQRWIDTNSAGSTVLHLNVADVRRIPIPVLPPLDEQRRIVDLLEDQLSRLDAAADGLLKARKRIDSFERSALDTHFAKGRLVPLADLIEDISAGKSFGTSNAPADEDDWGIIKVSAMTWGRFNPDENKAVSGDRVDPRFEIREGDLLVSRANTADYVGASVLVGPVRPKLLLSDKSLRLTPKAGINPEWLWRALQAPSARRQITASATGTKDSMRNISQLALRQVLLPKPGEAMQSEALNAFAAVAMSTNRLSTEIHSCRVRLHNLRRSLLAHAFSGRLTSAPLDSQGKLVDA
jgi:type I restriction enzyme, S subunit